MTATIQHNGILMSDIIDNQYYKKLYIGYTLKEAKQQFKRDIKIMILSNMRNHLI